MGMLDDAIREHLELKRLRGADPGEVARAENDALGPGRREAEPPTDGERSAEEASAGTGHSAFETSEEERGLDDEPAGEGHVGQETLEIDMEQALAEGMVDPVPPPAARADASAAVGHPAHTQPSSGDSLEWEMPGDRAKDAASDAVPDAEHVEDEKEVEDVLEETPEFLRETPEHERLWFEQRPPRDFDFNE